MLTPTPPCCVPSTAIHRAGGRSEQRPATQTSDQPPPEVIGLAIGSPLFSLSTGDREITINLGFYDDGGGPLPAAAEAFSVQVSTAKGWITPDSVDLAGGADVDYSKLDDIAPLPAGIRLLGLRLRLRFFLPAAPAIAGVAVRTNRLAHGRWFASCCARSGIRRSNVSSSVTRGCAACGWRGCTFAPATRRLSGIAPGQDLRSRRCCWKTIPVRSTASARSSRSARTPAAGAMLWIGHPDLLRKRLRSLRLLLEWMGGPRRSQHQLRHLWVARKRNFRRAGQSGSRHVDVATGLHAESVVSRSPTRSRMPPSRSRSKIAAVADSLASYTLPAGEPTELVRDTAARASARTDPRSGFGHQIYPGLVTAKAIQLATDFRQCPSQARPDRQSSPIPPSTNPTHPS